jgi:hypothetical protein
VEDPSQGLLFDAERCSPSGRGSRLRQVTNYSVRVNHRHKAMPSSPEFFNAILEFRNPARSKPMETNCLR